MNFEEWRSAHPVLRKDADKLLAYIYEHPGVLQTRIPVCSSSKMIYTLAYYGKIEKVKDPNGGRDVRLYAIPRGPITDEELDEMAKTIREYRGYSISLENDGLYAIKRFGIVQCTPFSTSLEAAKQTIDNLVDLEREKSRGEDRCDVDCGLSRLVEADPENAADSDFSEEDAVRRVWDAHNAINLLRRFETRMRERYPSLADQMPSPELCES
jgi:hypothetical protein